MENSKEFGIYLAELREKSGYKSQRQLYLASGISSATLSRIETGKQKPLPDTLKVLSKFLKGVTYEELMERAGYLTESDNSEKFPDLNDMPEEFRGWLKFLQSCSPEERKAIMRQAETTLEIIRSKIGEK